jgi:hypothetical protein
MLTVARIIPVVGGFGGTGFSDGVPLITEKSGSSLIIIKSFLAR